MRGGRVLVAKLQRTVLVMEFGYLLRVLSFENYLVVALVEARDSRDLRPRKLG